ncbi:zinc-binding dehydrogenase [Streptomyces sp. NWU339]|uniref:zinc-binding dehydrogenase n=1 Tax=Streptomyces sp. NWU339 TaxID=2185284 RepID=UPI0011B40EA3|nr:zinc-binding dehydrogenase [Streptomyces sp. NWU339]
MPQSRSERYDRHGEEDPEHELGPGREVVDAVKHGGRIVQIGLAREEATISMQQVTLKEITIVGASNGEKSEAEEVLKLMASGNITSKIVPITFEQIPEYVDKLAKGEVAGRAVAIL